MPIKNEQDCAIGQINHLKENKTNLLAVFFGFKFAISNDELHLIIKKTWQSPAKFLLMLCEANRLPVV